VRVRLRAEDLMLALEEPHAISANNVLACTIGPCVPRAIMSSPAHLRATRLVSRITAIL